VVDGWELYSISPPVRNLWELRAAISLTRLWQHQGKSDEERELLAPVYAWFTEGFNTANLQEAKGLLTRLS
jgi:predicted ATPase